MDAFKLALKPSARVKLSHVSDQSAPMSEKQSLLLWYGTDTGRLLMVKELYCPRMDTWQIRSQERLYKYIHAKIFLKKNAFFFSSSVWTPLKSWHCRIVVFYSYMVLFFERKMIEDIFKNPYNTSCSNVVWF